MSDPVNPIELREKVDKRVSEIVDKINQAMDTAVIRAQAGEGEFSLSIEMNGRHRAYPDKTYLTPQLLGSLFPNIPISEDVLSEAAVLLSSIITTAINNGATEVAKHCQTLNDRFMAEFRKEVLGTELESPRE